MPFCPYRWTLGGPWTITNLQPGISFLSLFEQLRAGSVSCFEQFAPRLQRHTLAQAFLGPAKDGLVAVDSHLPADDVCKQFGSYVRLNCEEEAGAEAVPVQNAFQIMMANQRSLSRRSQLPARIDRPRNNKDKLFNDLVDLFEEKNWKWCDGGDVHGKSFICTLRDALEARQGPIPDPFNKFVGYNTPEKSKHRKRQVGNLSFDILVKHVAALHESQMTIWMQQSRWSELRACVCKLTTVLDDYCSYMRQRCKAAKVRQESIGESSDSDSGTVNGLPTVTVVSSRLRALDSTMQEKPCYEKVAVNDYCSADPKKKYQYILDLRKGLTVSTILYTCSLGSNLGNYHFLWKIPRSVTLEAATNENVRIIDQIKGSLPTYHSRTLRKEFMNRFGLIAGNVKSHVLRQIYRELTGWCVHVSEYVSHSLLCLYSFVCISHSFVCMHVTPSPLSPSCLCMCVCVCVCVSLGHYMYMFGFSFDHIIIFMCTALIGQCKVLPIKEVFSPNRRC